jgi:AraC-like DNA-binding protein
LRRPGTVPGIYLFLLGEVLRGQGHDDAALLAGLSVERASLTAADSRVSVFVCDRALGRALDVAGQQGLGFAYARAVRVTLHGQLGLGLISSLNVADALMLVQRYLALRAPFLSLDSRIEGESSIVEVRADLAPGRKHDFVMEAIMLTLVYSAEQLLGRPVTEGEIWMQGEEPPYFARWRDELPLPLRYRKPACQLRGPRSLLQASPTLADPLAAQQARTQLEQELQQLQGGQDDLASRIRALLRKPGEALPTLDEVAASLCLSARTLKRRLQEAGLSYRELVDAELQTRACDLLSSTALPVSEIAYRLGYGDVSNFGRAFKRWTGLSPKDFRQGL